MQNDNIIVIITMVSLMHAFVNVFVSVRFLCQLRQFGPLSAVADR
jgi:hypothetical protein